MLLLKAVMQILESMRFHVTPNLQFMSEDQQMDKKKKKSNYGHV